AAADREVASAPLRLANGSQVGTVTFFDVANGQGVTVRARVELPTSAGARNAFHGLHIHANDDPANGSGCVADPAKPATTWFVSADGHLAEKGQAHGMHDGDFPSLLVRGDGRAYGRFATDRLRARDLVGRAVVLHALPDNFGHVPVGGKDTDYRPNSRAATDMTAKTGNAGNRIACGVIRRS
ncbi:MAG TPA: superoxide dismutase family protein, partial [Mycobacteriales bacterium]|nr:superoxide dismutase family protein [Mycobacteriales bacterium]